MAHTPGSWHILPIDTRGDLKRNGGRVYTLHSSYPEIAHIYGDDPNIESDACLIAAAPDLLDALHGLERGICFGDHGNIHDSSYICILTNSPEWRAARRAIRKAKGE